MLVLTRKVGEQIVIDGDIRVSVLCVGGNRVRIGIDAPTDARIVREELTGGPPAPDARPQARLRYPLPGVE